MLKTQKAAVEEMMALIRERFAEAEFEVVPFPEIRNTSLLWTYTNADPTEVAELIHDREIELLTERGVSVVVIPAPLSEENA
jgi:hypothetical protein